MDHEPISAAFGKPALSAEGQSKKETPIPRAVVAAMQAAFAASPTLSERAIAARSEAADAYLSQESMLAPAKSLRTRDLGAFAGYSEDFDAFWRMYPRKEGKGGAFSLWRRLSPVDRHRAYNALKNQLGHLVAKMNDQRGNYCPHGSTWLRERRFDDGLVVPTRQQPVERPTSAIPPGTMPFGKYRGQPIAAIGQTDKPYLEWALSVCTNDLLAKTIAAALDDTGCGDNVVQLRPAMADADAT